MNHRQASVTMNTSNVGKQKEFRAIFEKFKVSLNITTIPLREIDASPLQVIAHKASQLKEGTVVDDTILDVEGSKDFGAMVKYSMASLSQWRGAKATWSVHLAYQEAGMVHVFLGQVSGIIVQPRGTAGFGFDKYFQPADTPNTLAEDKPDRYNSRFLAVENLLRGQPFKVLDKITGWSGPWQE